MCTEVLRSAVHRLKVSTSAWGTGTAKCEKKERGGPSRILWRQYTYIKNKNKRLPHANTSVFVEHVVCRFGEKRRQRLPASSLRRKYVSRLLALPAEPIFSTNPQASGALPYVNHGWTLTRVYCSREKRMLRLFLACAMCLSRELQIQSLNRGGDCMRYVCGTYFYRES